MANKESNWSFVHKEHDHIERRNYYLFRTARHSPVFINMENYSETLKDYPYFEISADNQMSFYESLGEFIKKNLRAPIAFIIINTNNMTQNDQAKLVSLVKDRTVMCTELTDNCQIIVTGNKDAIIGSLLGLLIFV